MLIDRWRPSSNSVFLLSSLQGGGGGGGDGEGKGRGKKGRWRGEGKGGGRRGVLIDRWRPSSNSVFLLSSLQGGGGGGGGGGGMERGKGEGRR